MKARDYVLFLLSLCVLPAIAVAGYKEAIGYNQLIAEFGEDVPDGDGIPVAQIEFVRSNTWAPEATGELSHVTFHYNPPNTGNFSIHAYEVGQFFYGSESIAPGIDTVYSYHNPRWYVHIDFTGNRPPRENPWRVENHSWGGTTSVTFNDMEILARLDYRILHHNIFAAVGVDNKKEAMWPLLANTYNSIVVGVASGNHNRGGTTLYTEGRMKPDIVVPVQYTSYATPIVAAAATLLIARAEQDPLFADAAHSPAIKALLMAGATKDAFPGWSNSPTRPLDEVYGAGSVNIYNSYTTLLAGKHQPDAHDPARSAGWDWNETPATATGNLYPLTVRDGWEGELSAVLTWNAEPVPHEDSSGNPVWIAYDYHLDNLALHFWELDAQGEPVQEMAHSVSGIDNVQHIYLTDLPPGTYAFEVSGDAAGVPYALAWRTAPEAAEFFAQSPSFPHRLLSLRPNGGNSLLIQFGGEPETAYRIEASTNLVDWEPLDTVIAGPDGIHEYEDENALGQRQRFYRSVRE